MGTKLNIIAPPAGGIEAAPIVGIDLGTTFSLAATMTPTGPQMVRDADGDARVPSALGFGKDGQVTIGWEARRHAVEDPTHTVYSVKRLIGRQLADLAADLAFVPYQVVEREMLDGRKVLHVRIDNVEHTPEELSALILRAVVDRASAKLGRRPEKAVITVPASFDEAQRQARATPAASPASTLFVWSTNPRRRRRQRFAERKTGKSPSMI